MSSFSNNSLLSKATTSILCPPFVWCQVQGGTVFLKDASDYEGTKGGIYQVADFSIGKYPITNAQYHKFLEDPNGYANAQWWQFSPQAAQWHKDRPNPHPSAFEGDDLPRTRVSWFDSMAFCHWLSAELANKTSDRHLRFPDPRNLATWCVRLPTEQEWQRAALDDTDWQYPWGDEWKETCGNFANHIGQPSSVQKYPKGQSVYGVTDMIGNVWEWCLTGWGMEHTDISGYTYRAIRGAAWNVSKLDYLKANDRGEGWSPRGRLNDCGFRCVFFADESCYQE